MSTETTELKKAKAKYESADAKTKKLLEELFGKSAFVPDVIEKFKAIKTEPLRIAAAFKDRGLDPKKHKLDVSQVPERFRVALLATFNNMVVTEALNGCLPKEWIDWTNSDQAKYIPWPEVKADSKRKAGFGFSDSYYVDSLTDAHVGSRLHLKESRLATSSLDLFPQMHIDHKLK